ncbi:peroxiredoxin-like family protein [Exiguobacterium sp.]|uniref:peroxiredoxin-like family protein n=1 Tax=Exiguobacterium sp. TaxID=44751 RepID=UPI0028A5DB0E|nr:peroxiredoxin-like family protein [Exiguobacterium sp.]
MTRARSCYLNVLPGGWCPYCNLELRAYEREIDRIRAQGATVIAISPETPDFAERTANKNELSFPVLSEVDLYVSRQFDSVFDLPDYLIEIYKASGLDVAKHNGNEDWQLPKPATFIIDTNGVIRFAEVPSDYTKRVDPEHILQNLEQNKSMKIDLNGLASLYLLGEVRPFEVSLYFVSRSTRLSHS